MKKKLYVIGARGFGRDFIGWCRMTPGLLDKYDLSGFLDDDNAILDGYEGYPPIVGTAETFVPRANDVFFCAMGNVAPRIKYTKMILERGGKFDTFIAPSAKVAASAKIGIGCFIWNNVVICANTEIGNHVVCQNNAVVGHDTKIGDYSILDEGVACCGFVTIGEKTAVHTGAKIAPHVRIGSNVMVGIGSIVIRDVENEQSVFGNPARCLISPSMKLQ